MMKQLWRVSSTHVLWHQNTHIISEASYKWLQININCKSHHYTLCGLQALPPCQTRLLPSDVCGCLTSPAWVLVVSLLPPQTHALSQTHLCKDHYCCPLIQTVLICTPYLCDVTVYATSHTEQNKLCYKLSNRTLLPFSSFCEKLLFYFLTTSKGMPQLLCQHWAHEYVWRVSLA